MSWKWKLAQAAEIKWWQSYLSNKSPKDYLSDKRAYWIRLIGQTGIQMEGRIRVLDVGCGPAGIFIVLKDQEVDAVDPLLSKYATRLRHFNPADYPGVRFIEESLEQFRTEQPYDLVFCLNAINHVADLELAMDRLIACLGPKGRLWLSVDVHRYLGLQWIFQWFPGDILHPHQHTVEEYQRMLTDRGLQVLNRIKLKTGKIFDYYLLEAKYP